MLRPPHQRLHAMIGWLRRRTPWQGKHAVDLQHALAVEKTLASVRVLLVLVTLAVTAFERERPYFGGLVWILVAMAVYSVAAALALRAHRITSASRVAVRHAVDTVGILAALFVTGGVMSPFSTLFVFVLLAAAYRWGRWETWLTAAVGMLAFAVQHTLAPGAAWMQPPDGHLVALRITYVGVGGLLIGQVSEVERIHRYRAWSVTRILSRVRAEAGLVAAVHAVLDELTIEFRASHAVLVLEEEGNDRVSLWQAERQGEETRRATIRLNQESRGGDATYLFPVPARVDAFKVVRPEEDGATDRAAVLGLDAEGDRVSDRFSVAPLFGTAFEWRTAFCLSAIAGEGWRGRVFLFMPFVPPAPRQQLRYLQVIVRQVGPALFNLYLQRRLRSRAGVVERARISRELHDGVIQSLIGAEMQLEVMRRESSGKIPEATSSQLVHVQRILSQEILNVRDLMLMLKPAEVDSKRLVEHLADTVERFRQRTGIQARLACDADEIELAPRVCRELAGIVTEALANVRKHSGATSVVVRLGLCGANWQLVIDDNGKGLDFEGYLGPEEVEARRKGPVAIKERVRAIGGRLALHSQPGFGTRLEITIPGKHHG